MLDDHVPDASCVPYPRKSHYLLLTVPFLTTLILVGVYVWRFSPWVTAAMAFCYLWTCFFQAFWCAAQACPYIGRFCPAVAYIVPASWIAKWLYADRRIVASRIKLEVHAGLAILGWIGWTVLPPRYIARCSPALAVAYVAWQLVCVAIFGLTICPVCAIREMCPGGAFQRRCLRGDRR